MKRKSIAAVSSLFLLSNCMLSIFHAAAWAPNGAEVIVSCKLENAPQGTAYVDLLAQMDEQDADYSAFASGISYFPSITENSPAAQYREDGYVSLIMHQSNAQSPTLLWNEYYLFTEEQHNKEALLALGSAAVACVAADGTILAVSEPLDLKNAFDSGSFSSYRLDCAFSDNGTLSLDVSGSSDEKRGIHVQYWAGPNQQMPEGIAYFELLVPLDKSDPQYTAFNEKLGDYFQITEQSEIATYHEDGYCALSLHHQQYANLSVNLATMHQYDTNADDTVKKNSWEFLQSYKTVRAAYVDKDGNVLSVSEPVRIQESEIGGYSFDVDGSELQYTFHGNPSDKLDRADHLLIGVIIAPILVVVLVFIGGLMWFKRKRRTSTQ